MVLISVFSNVIVVSVWYNCGNLYVYDLKALTSLRIKIRAGCSSPLCSVSQKSFTFFYTGCGVLSAELFWFVFFLLRDNSLDMELLSGKKYPWNPPQPVPADAMTALVVTALGSYFSFPSGLDQKICH